MDVEVDKLKLLDEYKGYAEKDIYLVYLDEASAKARRFNEADGKQVSKQPIRSGSNHRGRRTDGDRPMVNQAFEGEVHCEVCGSSTHRHNECDVKWDFRSSAERPEMCMFKMANLPGTVFDTTWQSACSKGCLKNMDEASRSRQKTKFMDQRSRQGGSSQNMRGGMRSRGYDRDRRDGPDRDRRDGSRSRDRDRSSDRGEKGYYNQSRNNRDRDQRDRSRSPSPWKQRDDPKTTSTNQR